MKLTIRAKEYTREMGHVAGRPGQIGGSAPSGSSGASKMTDYEINAEIDANMSAAKAGKPFAKGQWTNTKRVHPSYPDTPSLKLQEYTWTDKRTGVTYALRGRVSTNYRNVKNSRLRDPAKTSYNVWVELSAHRYNTSEYHTPVVTQLKQYKKIGETRSNEVGMKDAQSRFSTYVEKVFGIPANEFSYEYS